jgi:hypothetical protein
MTFISFKSASGTVSLVASLLCLGGIISYVRADENSKPLALNIAIGAGAIAISNQLTSGSYESVANAQLKDIVARFERDNELLKNDSESLSQKYQKQSTAMAEIKKLSESQAVEIEGKEKAIKLLQLHLDKITTEFDVKKREIGLKLQQEDTRFSKMLTEFKGLLVADSSDRIYRVYNSLMGSIQHKLGSENYQKIHNHLEKFATTLQNNYQIHCELLKGIREIEGTPSDILVQSMDIYSQINDEIAALKVRYRNVLNVDERQSLEDAYTALADFKEGTVPKPKVKEALKEYSEFQKNQLENFKSMVDENQNSLNEMREQVGDLLDELDSRAIKINQLNQQIAELKKPQHFYGQSNCAVAANKISDYYYKHYGYKLDAINWEETPTGYQVIYGIRNNPAITDKEMYADNSREQLAAFTNALYGTLPSFDFNYQNCTLILTVTLRNAPKKVSTPQDLVNDVRAFLKPSESLIDFVRDAYHVGMWGETGRGKTTAISNTIGGMIQALGTPTIRTTVPKIDADTSKIFPTINWLGVPNSIFGLLEAALEIQYRISKNEQAFLSGQEVKDFEPILFFIDEINLIFSRWRKVNDADLDNVLERFSSTLSGERLEYFTEFMQIELRNYKNEFAKKLLMFIWQTGRSLRVKSLIAGQNLQPGAFGVMVNDVANCAYIAFGDSKTKCSEYKVKSSELEAIKSQLNLVEKAEKTDKQLQFTALYCPNVGSSFLSILPAPNTYEWDKLILCPKSPKSVDNSLDVLDSGQKKVQSCPTLDTMQATLFERFGQLDKLPERFQNLDYGGYVQLWLSLPKKPDGSVRKTETYAKIFNARRSDERKIISEFIDYLEKLCR